MLKKSTTDTEPEVRVAACATVLHARTAAGGTSVSGGDLRESRVGRLNGECLLAGLVRLEV
jgi:hypothetical protein